MKRLINLTLVLVMSIMAMPVKADTSMIDIFVLGIKMELTGNGGEIMEGVKITDVVKEGNANIVIKMSADNPLLSYEYCESHKADIASSFTSGFINEDLSSEFMEQMLANNGAIVVEVYFPKNDKTVRAEIPATYIRDTILANNSKVTTATSDPVRTFVDAMNGAYPRDTGFGMVMNKITVPGKIVQYNIDLNNSLMEEAIQSSLLEVSEGIVKNAAAEPAFLSFLNDMSKYGYKLLFVYNLKNSGQTLKSYVDYTKYLNGANTSGTITSIVDEANKYLPKSLGDGLTLMPITINGGDTFTYHYNVSGSKITYQMVEPLGNQFAESLLNEMINKDNNELTLSMLRNSGMNIAVEVFFPEAGKSLKAVRKYGSY